MVETLDKANSIETQLIAEVGKSVDENLDVHSVSLDFDPLANLKQISLSNSLDENLFLNLTSEALYSPAPNSSLKDLGFVSPCKAIVSKGYFLRSSTKSVQDISRNVKDKFGIIEVEEGLTGDTQLVQSNLRGVGALRASALNQVPL